MIPSSMGTGGRCLVSTLSIQLGDNNGKNNQTRRQNRND